MKCDELKRHRPDIMVVGEGKAMAVMPEDPMGVWCHIQDVHDILAEKDKEIESLKASHYAEMVDAGMRERRLRRALYNACANWAKCEERINNMDAYEASEYLPSAEDKFRKNAERWRKMERKCLKKAEEYK